MQIDVKVDPEAVEKAIVDAVIQSALGPQIAEAIKRSMTQTVGDSWNRKTIVQHAVDEEIKRVVSAIVRETVDAKTEEIRKQVQERMTEEVVRKLSSAAIDWMLDKTNKD